MSLVRHSSALMACSTAAVPTTILAELVGDGNGGTAQSTGWQKFEVNAGTLSAGTHTLAIGGFSNKKTFVDETTELLIDDVAVVFESSSALTFTPANWNVAQTVTVTAVDDAFVEGTHASTITHTSSSLAANFDGRTIASVVARITDNDMNQPPIVDAGPNQSILLSDVGILNATVTDEGAPDPPGAVVTTWTQVSGPGTVTFGDPSAADTTASFSAIGNYVLRLNADDGELMASDDLTVTVIAGEVREVQLLYFTYSPLTIFPGGLSVDNEDIVSFDGTNYSMVVDGSDLGLSATAIDAIKFINADEILMSFTTGVSLPGISGTVDDSDIVKFTATELGDTTVGTFELFFDASDVGLELGSEDVDAIELLDDGRLLISTEGDFSILQLTGQGEDILAFTPTSLGDTTAGTWSVYFDGDDVGLTGVGVDGVSVSDGGDIYLTTANTFLVPGLSGKDEDVFVFHPSSLGEDTTGTFDSNLLFDGNLHAAGGDLKAIDVVLVPIHTRPPLNFRVIADVPYDPAELDALAADLADLAPSDEFFVHLGDITSDGSLCGESVYTNLSTTLKASSIPVFILPGDNEWNECPNPDQAWTHWDANLMRLEENWSSDFTVRRQAAREENFAFVHEGVLFVGINLVGGIVHDANEWSQRMTDDANWVNENFNTFRNQVTSAVVFAHAFPDPTGGDRQQFALDFVTAARDFGKPILYTMGDEHSWTLDHPYPVAPNVTRVVLNKGVPSARVTVTYDPANPFAVDQRTAVLQSIIDPQPEAESIDGSQSAPLDANSVSATDALVIINGWSSQDGREAEGETPTHLDQVLQDVLQDYDALPIVNYLSRSNASAASEDVASSAEDAAPRLDAMNPPPAASLDDDLIRLLADDQFRADL